jgi:hypothetical protein
MDFMPKSTWQRTLTSTAAQLREQAAINDVAAAEEENAAGLKRAARAFREAALLLDDAEAMIEGAEAALVEDHHATSLIEPWVRSDLLARRRAGALDNELLALLREPARGGLTAAQARSVVAELQPLGQTG